VALGIGLALPFLFQHPAYVGAQYVGWLEHLRVNDRHVLVPHLWYRDLRLLTALVGLEVDYQAYQVVQLAVGVALAAICMTLCRTGCPRDLLLSLAFGLSCCWMTVFGSATESCTYILLAPTATWLVVMAPDQGGSSLGQRLGWVGCLLLGGAMVVQAPGASHPLWLRGVQPLAALLVLASLLTLAAQWMVRSSRRDPCPEYS
jgi:hypothetical protein